MRLRFLGHSCFKIRTKSATLVCDPYASEVGFSLPPVKADIVTVSHDHPDHNYVEGVKADPFVITGPGEYEVKEVAIIGIPSFHDAKEGEERGANTIYTVAAEDLVLCHLGDLGHALSTKTIEELGDIDVLFVPVGGIFTLDAAQASELVKQLEPRIVIPMHYRTKYHDQKKFAQVEPVETFLRLIGGKMREAAKLSFSRSSLGEEMEVIVLQPNHR